VLATKETNCCKGVLFSRIILSLPQTKDAKTIQRGPFFWIVLSPLSNKGCQNKPGSCFSTLVILLLPKTKNKTTEKKCFVRELFFHFSKNKNENSDRKFFIRA